MKAGNVLSVDRDFKRYLAVELTTLLKSSWITNRNDSQYFKPTDFALIDKIVDSTNEYISICSTYNIEYPPPPPPPPVEEKKEDKQEEEKDNDNEEEKKQMDIDDGTGNKDENKDNNNNKKDQVIDPARQTAIDQLLSIVPDDRELVVFALDTLQNNAPNNVSVALEWIFTHQEAWKKKKEDEAQLEK
eukprot:847750_1